VVDNPLKAVQLLKREKFNIVSLDHDLGFFINNREVTGYDVLKQVVEFYQENPNNKPNRVIVHSANIVGCENMLALIER
jgi:CheY-like chemotaxis protein